MPERRCALLVATSEYRDMNLAALPGAKRDVQELERVLASSLMGNFTVRTLLNRPVLNIPNDIDRFITEQSLGPEDFLLLHFSGHGIKDSSGLLYIAGKDTEKDYLSTTAIPASVIDRLVRNARPRKKVLVLDCCYSGAFLRGVVHRGDESIGVMEQFSGEGYVVITAADKLQYAFEGTNDPGPVTSSVFTGWFVRGIETGEADKDGDGRIGITELYQYIRDHIVRDRPEQKPQINSFELDGDIFIARTRPPEKGADVELVLPLHPEELQQDGYFPSNRTVDRNGQSKPFFDREGEPILITVKAGSQDGDIIRKIGLGEPGRYGGQPGDLIVRLHVIPATTSSPPARADDRPADQEPPKISTARNTRERSTAPRPMEEHPRSAQSGKPTDKAESDNERSPSERSALAPVDGKDIQAVVELTPGEAKHGGQKKIRAGGFSITVDIPADVRDGDECTVAGKGWPGQHGGRPGDLLVTFRVKAASLAPKPERNSPTLSSPKSSSQPGLVRPDSSSLALEPQREPAGQSLAEKAPVTGTRTSPVQQAVRTQASTKKEESVHPVVRGCSKVFWGYMGLCFGLLALVALASILNVGIEWWNNRTKDRLQLALIAYGSKLNTTDIRTRKAALFNLLPKDRGEQIKAIQPYLKENDEKPGKYVSAQSAEEHNEWVHRGAIKALLTIGTPGIEALIHPASDPKLKDLVMEEVMPVVTTKPRSFLYTAALIRMLDQVLQPPVSDKTRKKAELARKYLTQKRSDVTFCIDGRVLLGFVA